MGVIEIILVAFVAGLLLGGGFFSWLWLRERKRVRKDDLTGLPNYRAFLEQLRVEQQKMRSDNHSIGIALADIDDFRKLNAHGYARGDRVLKGFAERLSKETSGIAYCARYRLGDEFILLFHARAYDQVKTILQAINSSNYGGELIGFSYGMVIFSDPSLTDEQMIADLQVLLAESKTSRKKG